MIPDHPVASALWSADGQQQSKAWDSVLDALPGRGWQHMGVCRAWSSSGQLFVELRPEPRIIISRMPVGAGPDLPQIAVDQRATLADLCALIKHLQKDAIA